MTLLDGPLFIASLGGIAAASLIKLRFFALAGLSRPRSR
jgi:hypothetical protein